MLGLGSSIVSKPVTGKSIVRDSLVLKHNYVRGYVEPVSTGAASFTASNTDRIDLGVGNSLTPLVTGFTASIWVKFNATDQEYMILGSSNGTDQRMYIGTQGGSFDFGIGDATWSASTNTATTDWTHLALTVTTGGVATFYINGVEDRTDSSIGTFNDGTFGSDFAVGRQGGTSGYDADGYACNVGIWTAALTQAQVKSIMHKDYASLSASEKTGLVSWWNLDSKISEDYANTNETDDDPSTITGLTLDNHDTTFTEVSVANSDFTSGSGTTITSWTNENSQWTRVDDTVVSGTTSRLLQQAVLTNNIAHKVIVRAKNTTTDSTGVLRVYIGANNYAEYNLTNDFAEYTFHGLQSNDTTLYLYNASGTNVTLDWVKVYKYDGNVGNLL